MQLLVDRDQLFVGRAELLVGGFELFYRRLQALLGLLQLLLDLPDDGVLTGRAPRTADFTLCLDGAPIDKDDTIGGFVSLLDRLDREGDYLNAAIICTSMRSRLTARPDCLAW